jgi:hypothetical protein
MLFSLLVAMAAAVWLVLGRHLPRDQTVHVVLGESAPRVTEVRLRYAPAADARAFDRDVTFKYAPGEAPRVVTHMPRLADGDYHVEIEVLSEPPDPSSQEARVRVERRITLEGGTVSIDVSRSARR